LVFKILIPKVNYTDLKFQTLVFINAHNGEKINYENIEIQSIFSSENRMKEILSLLKAEEKISFEPPKHVYSSFELLNQKLCGDFGRFKSSAQ
jgi:hypothetical protein